MMRTMLTRNLLVPALLAAASGQLLGQRPAAPAAPAAPAGPAAGTIITDENGYKMIMPAIDPKLKPAETIKLRQQENAARQLVWNVLSGNGSFTENQTVIDNYFKFTLFANFSQTHDAALAELPE